MSNIELLKKAFVAALDLSEDCEVETLSYSVSSEWNSIAHMQLIAEVEDVFDVMLETEDILDFSSFTEACRILRAHSVDFDA
jgi:acyl carrier protein